MLSSQDSRTIRWFCHHSLRCLTLSTRPFAAQSTHFLLQMKVPWGMLEQTVLQQTNAATNSSYQ